MYYITFGKPMKLVRLIRMCLSDTYCKVRILKTSKKCDDGIESFSTTGVPKIFPTVAASLG
jgi:hypothetical protein